MVTGTNPPRPILMPSTALVTKLSLEHALKRPVPTPWIVLEKEKKKKGKMEENEEKLREEKIEPMRETYTRTYKFTYKMDKN